MKNKFSKFFVALLSTFLLFGGVVFTACGEAPHATISVSSQDFVSEDYIEIDLGSDDTTALITATVDGVSSGRVSVNNDFQSIISANAVYNESSNSTQITIQGKSEGSASIVLRSHEGNGQKVINVYVYSDILGVEQKQDSAGSSNQYVVKGEATVLDSDKFLSFTSREGGESNRKDVTWQLVSIDEHTTLEGNVLTVGQDSTLTNVLLRAVSVYKPEYYAEVNLTVISALPDIQIDFSRNPDAFSDQIEEGESFNIVKNDDSQEEAVGYIRLTVDTPTGGELPSLQVDRIVTGEDGESSARVSITTYNTPVSETSTQIIYQIRAIANDANTLPEVLNVRFDVGYENFNYTKSSVNFQINLVDVIDRIEVTSNDQTITTGDELEIYDNYNGDSSYQFGRPFVVSLGPDTVANDQALFDIELSAADGLNINDYIRIYNERGQQIVLEQDGNTFVARGIANNSLIYIRTAENFEEEAAIDCRFVSQQSPSVYLDVDLVCYRSPNANFSIGTQAVRYISTYGENTILVEVYSTSLVGINRGLSLSDVQSDLFEISNFSFDSATGTIRFNVSNLQQNISNENLSISLYIRHENGYRSIENIVIAPYLPMNEASITHQGQSSTAISKVEYDLQDFGAIEGSNSLQSLIMRLGSSVTLNLNTNSATSISFAFRYNNAAMPEDINADNLNNILGLFANAETEQDRYATFDYATNRLTLAANDFKGYVLFTFTGYDENHGQVLAYRIFYLESYTPPTRLSPNPSNLTLTALDSIAQQERDLASQSVSISYRVDGNAITYAGANYVSFQSVAGLTGTYGDNYIEFGNYRIENIVITNRNITFDIIAETTDGYQSFTDQIVVSYTVFGISYLATIDLVIENADRVEVVEWENASADGIVYLDLYGQSTEDTTYPLITNVEPRDAHNSELAYMFVPNAGTQTDLVEISDLGVVSINDNATVGGTGYIFIYPKDAVRVYDGIEQFVYYIDDENGNADSYQTPLTQLGNYFEQIASGYYNKIDGTQQTKIYYSQFIQRIEVVVADGLSEETATRIYNSTQLENIQTNRHYELMNSITLSNWQSLAALTGSLRGTDENVVISFTGTSQPLFESIGEGGRVRQFRVIGNVTGGGFIANENNGEISNITVGVDSTGETVAPSKVTGKEIADTAVYAGAIVGYNTGSITDVRVEGASVEIAGNSYAGMIAGYNSGTITNAYAEFYIFSSSTTGDGEDAVTTNQTNTISGQYVGGFVGYMAGGEISHSYVYNYNLSGTTQATLPLQGATDDTVGAFAGYVAGGRVYNSFSLIFATENDGLSEVGEEAEGATFTTADVYWGYGSNRERINNSNNWIYKADTNNFQSYVRNDEQHLTFYQEQMVENVNAFTIASTAQSVPVGADAGILYIYKLRSYNLSDSQNSELTAYNTISLSTLFGESGSNLVALSSNSNIAEIVGNNIVLHDVGDFELTISSKQNYSLSKTFAIKVLYVIDDFTISHNEVQTSGFTVQEGKSANVDFSVTSNIYLRGQSFNLQLNSMQINMNLQDETLKNNVDLTVNGMVGQITVLPGTKQLASNFVVDVNISVTGLDEAYNEAIMGASQRQLTITPVLGANDIRISADSLNIVPAYDSKLEVVLVTDEPSDDLILSVMKDDAEAYLTQRADEEDGDNLIFSFAGEDVLNIHVARSTVNEGQISYTLTISIIDSYRSTIMQAEGYTLYISSQTGTTDKENSPVSLTLTSQPINHVDITNYRGGNTSSTNGVNVYSRTYEAVSVLSPGRSSVMEIYIDPDFAYYEYMTLTYQNTDGAVLGITKMDRYNDSNNQYTTDTSSNVSYIANGVRVGRESDGFFAFRLTAAGNISQDTTFILSANFYDANGNLVCETTTYELYISYLPEAEITIDGEISALVAKGGNLQLTIMLRNDQTLDALIPENTTGITIAPESTWVVTDNQDGTKTITANLYANLNAGVLSGKTDEESGQPIAENGEFTIRAQVSRVTNGVQEIKTSYAYVTIVDFLPESASVQEATYDEDLGMDVLSAYIGIPITIDFDYTFNPQTYAYDNSNPDEAALAQELYEARNTFTSTGGYTDADGSFSINFSDDEVVPIYERLYFGNQRLDFKPTSDGTWVYSNSNFRLTYRQTNATDGVLTVLGLVTTSSPIQITLRDTITLINSGSNVSYTINTTFAIGVEVHSDQDLPLLIEDAEDFLQVAQEGTAQNYILMNDIYLQNYTPISAANFLSLDGNGHTIHIQSFNTTGSGTLNLALFTDIPTGSIMKNIKVNYYTGGKITVDTTSSGYSTINIAGFAITNNGTITNCEVVAYEYDGATVQNGDVGIIVSYVRGSTPYYIGDASITSNVAGFVITNAGSITNSKVGGEEIIVIGEQILDTNRTSYSTVELDNFVLSAQGQMAGFVLTNSGDIASSGVKNIQITNNASLTSSETGGFVVDNSGEIRTSYVEGAGEQTQAENDVSPHFTDTNISSRGIVAGFVVNNNTSGRISNGYSNILIKNDSELKSRTSAGFVYTNEGHIETSLSASYVEMADLLQLGFSGVDRNGNSLNSGTIELSYYINEDYNDDSLSDVQNVISNQATLVDKNEIRSNNAYYGFIFASENSTEDGVWMQSAYGPKLVSTQTLTVSHRYYVAISQDEYVLPYAILEDTANSSSARYNTAYGNDINPILITSALDFRDAMGESTSTYISAFFNDTEVFGSYRFTSDIDLSQLNNEQGNAEVQSIDKTFSGTIDGNGFAVNNISIRSSNNSVGLFGQAQTAVIKSLDLVVDNVTASNSYVVGGLVGLVQDSTIIDINLTQNVADESSSGVGVLGRNIAGGIIGAAFGSTRLNGLTVNNVIVQASYYDDNISTNTSSLESMLYRTGFNPTLIRNSQRQNINNFYSNNMQNGGVGMVSFAGGIVGYLDIYNSLEASYTGFVYGGITSTDYSVTKLLTQGSVDVRGEVAGGVFGYTGYQTKAQDIGIKVAKSENSYASILSYNYFAGGIAGLANGQFYQVYAEHEESVQDAIENTTSAYYISANTSTERGVLDLFRYTGQEGTGEYRYYPKYVGGLMGVMGSGTIYVGYNKLNAINYTTDGVSYAGGIAGAAIAGSSYYIDNNATQLRVLTNLYMQEVYSTGDVYAYGGEYNGGAISQTENHAFGGLFGVLEDNENLVMSSVNSFAHYGILDNPYYEQSAENTTGATIYAVAGKVDADASVTVMPSSTAISNSEGNTSSEITSLKSFGYMNSYSAAGISLTVEPYPGYDAEQAADADYYFVITSVSSFTSQTEGFTITNGAFINSRAWSNENWVHTTNTLYPEINFVNTVNYIYLDQNNVEIVLDRMQNSSIEVRVRGRNADGNGYGMVDLRGYDINIEGFSGTIVGYSTSADWGEDNAPELIGTSYYEEYAGDTNASGYPGLIISKPIFESTGSGFSVENLNIVVEAAENSSTENSSTVSVAGGIISSADVTDATIEGVTVYVRSPIVVNDLASNAGLLVPNAVNTSFRNIEIIFAYNLASGSSYIEFRHNPDEGDNNDGLNVGLLAGTILQNSIFEALRIQNITIKHPSLVNANNVFQVNASGSVYAGLYAGRLAENISNGTGSSGDGEEEQPTTPAQNYAGVIVEVKAPELTGSSTGDSMTSSISIASLINGETPSTLTSLTLGGYFGELTSQNARLTLSTEQTYTQKIALRVSSSASSVMIGGIAGTAQLQNFEVNNTAQSNGNTLSTDVYLGSSAKLTNTTMGMLFGEADGSFNIQNLTVNGLLQSTAEGDAEGSLNGDSSIGGLIGSNHATISAITNVAVNFDAYKDSKPTLTNSAFTANANNSVAIENLSFGGFIGTNYGSVSLTEGTNGEDNTYNNSDDNYVAFAGDPTTFSLGDLIGSNVGNGLSVSNFSSNGITVVNAADTSKPLSIGGLIGSDNTAYITNIAASSSGADVQVLSNFFISAQNVNAGGMIGNLVTATSSNSKVISNAVFGGAFKFNITADADNAGGTHSVGGMIGKVPEPSDGGNVTALISIENTINYGDAIYTYADGESGQSQLATYYFGGIAGQSVVAPEGNKEVGIQAEGNIIAFTNNNPRLASSIHETSALIGDGASASLSNNNYYSSQLVLAVSDETRMVDSAYVNESGYAGYGTVDTNNILYRISTSLGGTDTDMGTKINPVTGDGSADATNTNGITYYAVVPSEGDFADNFAYIGDFAAINSAISTVGEHSFVAGVVVNNKDADDESSTYEDQTNVGGLVHNLNGGIIYASMATGTLSVGGTNVKNIGGLVGLMNGGLIAESTSSVNIVYRAGKNGTTYGTASGIATTGTSAGTTGTTYNYFDKVYSTGEVASYISANVYAFTNGTNATVRDSYTISKVNRKDYTAEAVSGTIGVFGEASAHDNAENWYDGNATEVQENVGASATNSTTKTLAYDAAAEDPNAGWKQNIEYNYGYPTRNFAAFDVETTETVDKVKYYLIPNATKLAQIDDGPDLNYKLVRDIDLSKTSSYKSAAWTSVENSAIFDGDGHTINGLIKATLFSSADTIQNLRVTNAEVTTGNAVVANSIENATNVIASGTLTITKAAQNSKIGGLFAASTYAGAQISNCKNYVAITADGDGLYVGGIIGSLPNEGGNLIKNCYNYSPITVNSANGYVGGIAGQAKTIENSGNENTVFNGYTTKMTTTNATTKNNYYAGGIAGTATTVSDCYNTSMVKAGHKSNTEASYAAGIIANGTTVTGCENSGFIEALGSTSAISNSGEIASHRNGATTATITWSSGSTTPNVYASAIALDNDGKTITGACKNVAQVYRNGLYGSTSNTESVSVPENEPSASGTVDLGNGITISRSTDDDSVQFVVAELDELGGIRKFYIKSTRRIYYNGAAHRDQTRYWEVKEISNTYADRAWINADATVEDLKLIKPSTNNEQADVTNVTIAGSTYAFVNNGTGLKQVLQGNMSSTTGDSFETIGGVSVTTLYNAGYTFNVVIDSSGDGIDNVSGRAEYSNGSVSVTLNYTATGTGSANISYHVEAVRTEYVSTQTLNASNLIIENDTLKIIIDAANASNFEENSTYYVELAKEKYQFDFEEGELRYTGSEDINTLLGTLNGQQVTINLTEGRVSTEQQTAYVTAGETTTWSQDLTGSYSKTSETYERITQYVAQNDVANNEARDVILSSVNTGGEGFNEITFDLTRTIQGKVTSISFANGLTWTSSNRTINIGDTTTKVEFRHNLVAGTNGNIHATRFEYDESQNVTYITLHLWRKTILNGDGLWSCWNNVMITYNFDNSYVSSPYGSTETQTYTVEDDTVTVTYSGNGTRPLTSGTRAGKGTNSTISYESYYYTYNYVLDNISVNVAADQWALYSYNGVSQERFEQSTITFDNLNGATSTLKNVLCPINSILSYTYTGSNMDDNATTASLYTVDPILYDENSAATSEDFNLAQGGSGTVTLDGVTYNFTVDSEGRLTSFTQGSTVWTIDEDNSVVSNSGNYLYYTIVEEGTTANLVICAAYKGTDCILNVGGTELIYTLDEEGDFVFAGNDSYNGYQITIGSVTYRVSPYTQEADPVKASGGGPFTITSNDNGTVTLTYKDSNLRPNQYVVFNIVTPMEDQEITISLNNNVIDGIFNNVPGYANASTLINTIEYSYTLDGKENTGSDNDDIGPFTEDVDITINATYKSFETGAQTATAQYGGENKTVYAGIVLTNDINVGDVDVELSLSVNLTSTNNNIVNYTTTSQNGFFTSGTLGLFIKNTSFAGTVLAPNSGNAGILATSIASSLNDVSTYGTINTVNIGTAVTAGGVAGTLTASLSNVINYASFSNTQSFHNMSGVAYTISGNISNDISNYGTIIGVRGDDGTGAGAAGFKGQDVYAIANTISSQNVNSANVYNYGVVKAGDGGNGRRGADGVGGSDSSATTIRNGSGYNNAPTRGYLHNGDGGIGGDAGKAYLYGQDDSSIELNEGSNSKNVYSVSAGSKGSQGNDGWGGLNLHKYEEQFGYGSHSFSSETYTWRGFLLMWQNASNTRSPIQLTSSLRFGLKSMSSYIEIDYYNDSMIVYCRDGFGSAGDYNGDFVLYDETENILFQGHLNMLYAEAFGSLTVTVYKDTYINCYVTSAYTSATCCDYVGEEV